MKPDRVVWVAGRLVLLLAGLAFSFAACTQTPFWQVQSWGDPKPQATFSEDESCRNGLMSGWRFAKVSKGGGGAELIVPTVLQPGQGYEFSVQLKAVDGGLPVVADLAFRRDGPFYEASIIRPIKLDVGAWQTVVLRGRYTSLATGSVRLNLPKDGSAVCVGKPTLKQWSPADDAPVSYRVPKEFFGIHLNKLGRHNGWPVFDPDVVRMWSTGTSWAELQPAPGPIDWRSNVYAQRLDYFVRHVSRQQGEHQMVMTLGMTPAWAAAKGDASACSQSPFGAQTCMPPADLNAWRLFVRELAQRYQDSPIKVWEIWNEADVGMHWVGDTDLMVAMVRIAAEEIKALSPRSLVLGPNVTSLGMRFLHDFLSAGGGQYIDGVSVHVYSGRSPKRLMDQIRNVKDLIQSHGLSLPIWNTETNTACGGGPDSDRLLEQVSCSAMPAESAMAQSLMGQAALGVRNVSLYTWEGAELNVGGVGLVEADFRTETLAGVVLDRVVGLLRGSNVVWSAPTVEGLQAIDVISVGRICKVMWTDSDAVQVPVAVRGVSTWAKQLNGQDVDQLASGEWRVSTMPVASCIGSPGW